MTSAMRERCMERPGEVLKGEGYASYTAVASMWLALLAPGADEIIQ